jgi:uncharacterized protein with NRDE domain
MCTIVALCRVHSDFPLLLATNRDEFHARASTGPTRLAEAPSVVGGRDLAGGGSWMGVSERGLFVGVTNQRNWAGRDPTRRSRGELVMHALGLGEPGAIRRWLATVDGSAYNGFNLMFGDAATLYVAYGREQREVEVESVPEGVHVLPNDRLDAPHFLKVQRARELIGCAASLAWPQVSAALQTMLADGLTPPLETLPDPPATFPFDKGVLAKLAALCVRTPLYGTRSSTVVALVPGGVAHYLYADGPPDEAPFVDVTPLF